MHTHPRYVNESAIQCITSYPPQSTMRPMDYIRHHFISVYAAVSGGGMVAQTIVLILSTYLRISFCLVWHFNLLPASCPLTHRPGCVLQFIWRITKRVTAREKLNSRRRMRAQARAQARAPLPPIFRRLSVGRGRSDSPLARCDSARVAAPASLACRPSLPPCLPIGHLPPQLPRCRWWPLRAGVASVFRGGDRGSQLAELTLHEDFYHDIWALAAADAGAWSKVA